MAMTRKEFLRSAAAVVGGGLALGALGCGDGGGGGQNCTSSIQLNHGHSLTVPRADAQAGAEKTYQIRGGADHDHTVTLTAAQYATLLGGTPVTVTSSIDADLTHDHQVTVTCA